MVLDQSYCISLQSETEVKAQKKKLGERPKDPPTSPQEHSAAPAVSTLAAASEGPRQRLHAQANSEGSSPEVATSSAANVSMVPPTVNRATIQTNPADIPRRSSGAMRFGSLLLIWLLLLVIGALVMRRIYIMSN